MTTPEHTTEPSITLTLTQAKLVLARAASSTKLIENNGEFEALQHLERVVKDTEDSYDFSGDWAGA